MLDIFHIYILTYASYMNNTRNTSCRISSICQIYSIDLNIPNIFHKCLSALVSVHMLRMCLWHAWSDVCCLFHCFFYWLKALNENCTYGRHIPLQINHMSDTICYNDFKFSTVTAELIIFLLLKLWNGYMHWNQRNPSFWHGGIFQVYIYLTYVRIWNMWDIYLVVIAMSTSARSVGFD